MRKKMMRATPVAFKRLLACLLLFYLFCVSAFAQGPVTISGLVKDKLN